MPLTGAGLIEGLPLALVPDGGGGEAFLAEGIHGDAVEVARGLAGGGVGVGGFAVRFRGETGEGVLVVAASQAIAAVAAEGALEIGRPPGLAGGPGFACETGRRDRNNLTTYAQRTGGGRGRPRAAIVGSHDVSAE